MNTKTIAVFSALLLSASVAYAAPTPTVAADRDAARSACADDAKTANCPQGKGMRKCIHAYKRAHPEFKVSDSCKGAVKQLRADKKAGK